ncbi:MAG TPA: VOC family protein [Sphingomicrobium sp.]|nr:VOC family protein [Sphingomicrobium sp.]
MADQSGSFIWYELMTTDAAGAKRFYDAVIGWDIEPESSMPGMDYRMIRRNDGGDAGGVMPLTDAMCEGGARPIWLGYIGVEDVDVAVQAVEADGGKLMMPAFDVPDVGRIALVADPDGAAFYLMTPATGEDGESDAFSADRAQHIRWNELSAADSDRAVDFYTRHFGWRQEGAMEMGELGQYRFLHKGETMIGAVMPKPAKMPRPQWTFYIGVDDIDRAAAAIESSGGTIFSGPVEIPGGEYAIDGFDPQGAAFGVVGPRKQ